MALLLAAVANAAQSRAVLDDAAITERPGHALLPDAVFQDQAGAPVRFGALADTRPVLLVPVDLDCGMICPLTLRHLAAALRESGLGPGDYRVVVVGIDPRDGPAAAASAAAHAPAHWTFLTGKEAAIQSITDAIGFRFAYDAATDQFAHPAVTVVLTPDERVSMYLYGLDIPGAELRRAVESAAAGRASTAFDRVLLRCYRYFPALRQHAGLVRGVLLSGGILTLLALALTIGSSIRRTAPAVVIVQADAGRGMRDFLEAVNDLYRFALGLPEQASTIAWKIDALHFFEITVMFAVAGLIGAAASYFVIRYRRRPGNETTPLVRISHGGEVALYSGLLGLFVLFWIIGFRQFTEMGRTPENALDVYVTAKQWMWKFSYPEGPASVGVLYVPAGRPIRLNLGSRDVIHSFFVPEFRIKRDAVPGMYTSIWFEAPEPGRYPIFCAEFCGTGHSTMRAEVIVLRANEYDDWITGRAPVSAVSPSQLEPAIEEPSQLENRVRLADIGRQVAARRGCLACHSLDGTASTGPTWLGLYNRWEQLANGERIYVNEAYITQSMMDPQAQIVAGYPPVMPSYLGQMSPAETAAIIELLKALAPRPGGQ